MDALGVNNSINDASWSIKATFSVLSQVDEKWAITSRAIVSCLLVFECIIKSPSFVSSCSFLVPSTFCFWLLHLDWIQIMGLALLNPTPHFSGFGLQIYFCKTWLPVFFGFRLRIYLSWAWLPVFWPCGFGSRFLECAQIKRPSSYILLVFVFI